MKATRPMVVQAGGRRGSMCLICERPKRPPNVTDDDWLAECMSAALVAGHLAERNNALVALCPRHEHLTASCMQNTVTMSRGGTA